MRFYLLTVESSRRCDDEIQVRPRVSIKDLIKRGPNLLMPMRGDRLELCLPDSRILHATIAMFGVEVWTSPEALRAAPENRDVEIWKNQNNLYMAGDPSNPMLTLTIAGGNLRSEDVPPGTEIWLSEAKTQISTSGE